MTPMPLARRREPFDDREWLFEVKLDGFRAVLDHERKVAENGGRQ